MKTEDWERFTEDLRVVAGLDAAVEFDPNPNGLHILRINKVDFFFHADGSGYDLSLIHI